MLDERCSGRAGHVLDVADEEPELRVRDVLDRHGERVAVPDVAREGGEYVFGAFFDVPHVFRDRRRRRQPLVNSSSTSSRAGRCTRARVAGAAAGAEALRANAGAPPARRGGRRFARAAQDVGALAHQAAQGFQDALRDARGRQGALLHRVVVRADLLLAAGQVECGGQLGDQI